MLDEPKPVGYGGYTAGPIFRQVAKRIAGLDENLQLSAPLADDNTQRIMPNLIGLSKVESELITRSFDTEIDFEGDFGTVVSQIPSPLDSLYNVSNIQITLSGSTIPDSTLSEGYRRIPDVSGMSMRNASNTLSALGFKVDRVGSGTVFAQFPRKDEVMRIGRTITIRGKARSLETRTLANLNN